MNINSSLNINILTNIKIRMRMIKWTKEKGNLL